MVTVLLVGMDDATVPMPTVPANIHQASEP